MCSKTGCKNNVVRQHGWSLTYCSGPQMDANGILCLLAFFVPFDMELVLHHFSHAKTCKASEGHRRTILRYLKQKCASPTEPLWGDARLPPRVCEAWACCFSGLASCLAPKVLGACLRTWTRNLRGWEAGHGKPDLAEKSCSKISKEFQRLLRSESLSKVSWRLLFRPIG